MSLDVQVALDALKRGDIEFAAQVAQRILTENPDEPEALRVMAESLIEKGHEPVARVVAMRAWELHRTAHNAMLIGAVETFLGRPVEAAQWFNRALKRDPNHSPSLRLMAHSMVMQYRFEAAEEYANRALAIEDHHQARCARAFSYLHKRDWGPGWDDYAYGMGRQQFRDVHQYLKQGKPLPEWDGKAPGRVLVYAEQGLGDQIAFCSAAVDPQVSEVVCDPKLTHILQRSVPGIVHGDQFAKEVDWEPRADHAISMSGFMRFRRRTKESFPRTPYLKPHPQKRLMSQALLDSLGDKPKIGIAWTGGKPGAVAFNGRNLTAAQLAPVLSLPYEFVSLEYREGEPIPGVHEFPWLSRSKDFDDVAALISCLDAVVCVPTTAYHAAGALGIQSFVVVHDKPHFHEGTSGSESPWWATVEFVRRSELGTKKAVEAVATKLETFINEHPSIHRHRPEAGSCLQRPEMEHRAASA